jgi:hypothetical protein
MRSPHTRDDEERAWSRAGAINDAVGPIVCGAQTSDWFVNTVDWLEWQIDRRLRPVMRPLRATCHQAVQRLTEL